MKILNLVIQGLLLGGFYALFAAGLSLVFGVMRIVNLAHGDLSIVAAYFAVILMDALHLSVFAALLPVILLLFAIGYGLQAGLLNRIMGSGVMRPLLVTFGLSVIIQNVLLMVFSSDPVGLKGGAMSTGGIQLSDSISVGYLPVLTLVLSVVLLFGLETYLRRTRGGRAVRATSDDDETAQLMGINHRQIYCLAMALALGLVAVAGVVMGVRSTFAPSLGSFRLIFAYEAVIIGGMGSIWGTFLGALALGVAQSLGSAISPAWALLAGHAVFLAMLAFRPTGLLPKTVGV
ncbi:MAG: branched-chain amino acid ABC transporter permease [Actinobacteria bacterium]|nr:branched-chain amino acid ABC transporter permease [Actinomycetota bacterium]MCL5736619.1 branched-chain amino acid ABC transporter permease [Actinomycetota bacterium]